MSDGTINVKFASLAAGEDALNSGVTNLQSKLTTLEAQLQPLVRSWSGDAQTAYLAQKQKWDTAASDLHQLLATIKNALADAHQNYRGADGAVMRGWEG